MILIKGFKNSISFLLIFMMVAQIFVPLFAVKIFAAIEDDDGQARIENGIIKFKTLSTKATSSIRYRTIGFTIHRDFVPMGNPTQIGKPFAKVYLEQTNEEDLVTQVRTYFEVPENAVNDALIKAGLDNIKNNDEIYLSAIFEVRKYDSKGNYTVIGLASGYDSLEGIKKAQGWSNPNDFNQYFNIRVPYRSALHPLSKEIILDGKAIKSLSADLGRRPSGETANVSFYETIDYEGNKYQLERSYYKKNSENLITTYDSYTYPDPRALNYSIVIPVKGAVVYGEYKSVAKPPLKLKVNHINADTGIVIETTTEEFVIGTTISKSKKVIPDMLYLYNQHSKDNSVTFTNKSQEENVTFAISNNSEINFYYSKQGKAVAVLNLRASPDIIESGKTAIVEFTLDSSYSVCDKRTSIVKYEFWLSENQEFPPNILYTNTQPVKTIQKTGVKPGSTYYGKVRITDGFGNTAEAFAQVKIGEFTPEPEPEPEPEPSATPTPTPRPEAYADLQVIPADNSRNIVSFVEDENLKIPDGVDKDSPGYKDFLGGHRYFVEIKVPGSKRYSDGSWGNIGFDFVLDGSYSISTNGVGEYLFMAPYPDRLSSLSINSSWNEQMLQTQSATTSLFYHIMQYSLEDAYNGIPPANQMGDWAYDQFALKVSDSKDPSAESSWAVTYVLYKYTFEKSAPDVTLSINKKTFSYGETGYFTPKIIGHDNTYSVKSQRYEIFSSSGQMIKDEGGYIPSEYSMSLPLGDYRARQYITYYDDSDIAHEKYAEVSFTVVPLCKPDVTIKSDKEKYVAPVMAYFTVDYLADLVSTYSISNHEYALKDNNGNVLESGYGTFPEELYYNEDSPAGIYTAEQTIYWYEDGVEHSKTVSCTYKVISPKPVADFAVSMRTSIGETWDRIDVPGLTGKQYRQIRINLTPSIAINEELENPYPLLFSSPNTEIQITPLKADGSVDTSKNSTILTPNANDMSKTGSTASVKSKQYIDIRFDSYGTYKISVRVANAYYTSAWVSKNIVVREDLPPLVRGISFTNTSTDPVTGERITYRQDNLHAILGVNIDVISQDDDLLDFAGAKLSVQYDYNTDNNITNDGEYSKMYVAQNSNYILDCIYNVTKNESMSSFVIDMFNSSYPMLGKVRFDYSIAKKPVIPYFIGGSMPSINIPTATTHHIADINKTVLIDNRAGALTVDLGSESVIEVVIFMDDNQLHFNIGELRREIAALGKKAKIYMIDKNGTRTLVE